MEGSLSDRIYESLAKICQRDTYKQGSSVDRWRAFSCLADAGCAGVDEITMIFAEDIADVEDMSTFLVRAACGQKSVFFLFSRVAT